MIQEIRCAAPHPVFDGAQCRRKLAVIDGPPVRVVVNAQFRPGCIEIPCPRCGTANLIAPQTLIVFTIDGIVTE